MSDTENLNNPGEILINEAGIAAAIESLADRLRPRLKPDCVAICLLTGGIWFSADLMRALSRRGLSMAFDALWLSSYGDGTKAQEMILRADLQRPVAKRQVLIIDDILDTGASLKFARYHCLRAGAAEVITAVFARKPNVLQDGAIRAIEADFVGWEAPDRFLVGYGLDRAGLDRGLPHILALD